MYRECLLLILDLVLEIFVFLSTQFHFCVPYVLFVAPTTSLSFNLIADGAGVTPLDGSLGSGLAAAAPARPAVGLGSGGRGRGGGGAPAPGVSAPPPAAAGNAPWPALRAARVAPCVASGRTWGVYCLATSFGDAGRTTPTEDYNVFGRGPDNKG